MKLYSIQESRLKSVSNSDFGKENEIQKLIEKNFDELFNVDFVGSEFSFMDIRIDSIGFDNKKKSFVFIEYKLKKDHGVLDQGLGYISTVETNRIEFLKSYNKKFNKKLEIDDIDWDKLMIKFISTMFTKRQKMSLEQFRIDCFELWEIEKYDNNMIRMNQLKSSSSEIYSTINDKKKDYNKVSKKVNDINKKEKLLYSKKSDFIKGVYLDLRGRILNLGSDVSVSISPSSSFIRFYKINTKFSIIIFRDFSDINHLKILIPLVWKGKLNDPKKIMRNLGNDRLKQCLINENTDLDYIMFLINQSYKKQN